MEHSTSSSGFGCDVGGRLTISAQARRCIRLLCRDRGRQALLVAWPGGAAYLPLALYVPSDYDVIIGHVLRCPIYADVRQIGFAAEQRVILDATTSGARPLLRLRSAPSLDGGRVGALTGVAPR